jgi:glycosyltransferase involved in cell wall biosynthesis
MAARTPISACVISYNEERCIARCLTSLRFCDEIVVLDSRSTDRTVAIAREHGAQVHSQEFLGYVAQKNRAVELATHRWILALDCDEWVSPELHHEIDAARSAGLGAVSGFTMPRRNRYLGKVIRHGLFWPDRKLRLFDREQGRWGGTDPHDKVSVAGVVRELRHPIDHDSYRSFADHRRTVDNFSRIAARAMCAEGRRFSWVDLLVRPPFQVLKSLLFKAGFLDGWRGFVIAGMAGWYDLLKYHRLRQEWRRGGRPA